MYIQLPILKWFSIEKSFTNRRNWGLPCFVPLVYTFPEKIKLHLLEQQPPIFHISFVAFLAVVLNPYQEKSMLLLFSQNK